MAFTIQMTPRGVLLAGKFRTEAELNKSTNDGRRNTIIVELTGHTNQSGGYFQGLSDNDLVGRLAMAVFLMEAGVRDRAQLQQLSDDDQRNVLIVTNEGYTDLSVGQLQGKTNQELVQIGLEWLTKSRTLAAILEFYWNIDQAKVLGSIPDIIHVQSYDNRKSSSPLEAEFSFTKDVTNSSSFSQEHGFEISLGVETKFTAGIPGIAANETTVALNTSTTHNWSFGGENSTTQSYSHKSAVNVPPRGNIQRVASVTKGTLDVPYRAKIRTGDGSINWIEGTWKGVSTVNCVAKQVDL